MKAVMEGILLISHFTIMVVQLKNYFNYWMVISFFTSPIISDLVMRRIILNRQSKFFTLD
jgi:hypothetical protein